MIVVAGSANLDHVLEVPRIPAPGETLLARAYSTAPGGKGANQAVAAARAGGVVRFLGAVGSDAPGAALVENLQSNGVETGLVARVDAPTGQAFINVSADGENNIVVVAGANALVAAPDGLDLSGASHLVLQLEIPVDAAADLARRARLAGAEVVLNAAPARALPEGLLSDTTVLVVNQHELEAVAGVAGRPVEETAGFLLGRGPEVVVVTLGAQGALAVSRGATLRQPAHPVQAVDTTGAGDTFTGVLATWLAEGAGLGEAVRAASAAAALSCTRPTAQGGMPHREEIERLLASG
ncbi:MAG TPA: ribokinase [Deinococcales bacterium]|nr:ribokinase [Deinococcales bacterium]